MTESAQKVISELTSAGLLSSERVTDYSDQIESGIDVLLDKLVADGRITDFQKQKLKEGKSSDIYFGDYVVINQLGQGGMGTVLLAKHKRMDRQVAIKVLPVTALESRDAVARFYQEVKVAGKLTHPNIVHAYDAGEQHGFHYLVMEYVPGHDLAEVLSQLGPVPLPMVLDYIKQVCKGLDYAHRKGIVHRDIKPSNLLLNDEGDIKILDMGLARIGGSAFNQEMTQLTTTGQVMGTVEYMSPEQAEDTRQADQRSDIYSLGCSMYRLLTGESPFGRDTVVKTILAHRTDQIPKIATGFPEDDSVNLLFQKMVAKSPDDRFQSAAELLEAIEKIEDGDVWQSSTSTVESRDGDFQEDIVPPDSVEIVNPANEGVSFSNTNRHQSTQEALQPNQFPASSTHDQSQSTVQELDNGILYIPDQSPETTIQTIPSRFFWLAPIAAVISFFVALSIGGIYPVPIVISWMTWRKANQFIAASKTGLINNINRTRARRIKWVCMLLTGVSILGLIVHLLSRIGS